MLYEVITGRLVEEPADLLRLFAERLRQLIGLQFAGLTNTVPEVLVSAVAQVGSSTGTRTCFNVWNSG